MSDHAAKKLSVAPPSPGNGAFPFRTYLDLTPLLEHWQGLAAGDNPWLAAQAKEILRDAERRPELFGPKDHDEGVALVQKHRAFVDALMAAIFATGRRESELACAIIPYNYRAFYTTPRMASWTVSEDGRIIARPRFSLEERDRGRALGAYFVIARRLFGMALPPPMLRLIFEMDDPATRMARYFDLQIDPTHARLKVDPKAPVLGDAEKARLTASPFDLALWQELLPPEFYSFTGFAFMRATDVTRSEVLADVKQLLIERESITSVKKIRAIEERLCVLLGRKGLTLGLVALHEGGVLRISSDGDERQFIPRQEAGDLAAVQRSAYGPVLRSGRVTVLRDVQACLSEGCCLDDSLRTRKVGGAIVAPLVYMDSPLGFLELSSTDKLDLSEVEASVLRDVLPLIAIAVRRGLDELTDAVDTVIKRQCTAIHPAVEWRFRDAALRLVESQTESRSVRGMEAIVFKDVFPLFAGSDIRGSSSRRNAAIREDLDEQLRLAGDALDAAAARRRMPILGMLSLRVSEARRRLEGGLPAGDELAIHLFLDHDVEPALAHLAALDPALAGVLATYRSAVDGNARGVYRARARFDESVRRLNAALAAVLDQAQQEAQAIYPHYFERSVTDGVEHELYVGASLSDGRPFDRLHVRDLRIWQLELLAKCARENARIRPELAVPLETCHLVLTQESPMTIAFDYDEKRFAVEGAYNIRYEILKKRLDKATVQGTGERLTQPDQIAIVYSQDKERAEYVGYVEYLTSRGLLAGPAQELTLEDLQGAQGLRALRVRIVV